MTPDEGDELSGCVSAYSYFFLNFMIAPTTDLPLYPPPRALRGERNTF